MVASVGVILLLAMLVIAKHSGCLAVPIGQERKKLTASVTNPLEKGTVKVLIYAL